MNTNEVRVQTSVEVDGGFLSAEATESHILVEFKKDNKIYVVEDSHIEAHLAWPHFHKTDKDIIREAIQSEEKRLLRNSIVREYMLVKYQVSVREGVINHG